MGIQRRYVWKRLKVTLFSGLTAGVVLASACTVTDVRHNLVAGTQSFIRGGTKARRHEVPLMQTLNEIKGLLAQRGVRPRKRLGQHFLHDHNQLRRLVDAAALRPGDLVLEVGPGTGTLTEALLETGAEVVACEIDGVLASIVRDRLGDRLCLIEGDCLGRGRRLAEALVAVLGDRPFTLVANLPYQVATRLIVALLRTNVGPR